ncbi:hypothetical protein LTS17_007453 [Exophiala oligosperma]
MGDRIHTPSVHHEQSASRRSIGIRGPGIRTSSRGVSHVLEHHPHYEAPELTTIPTKTERFVGLSSDLDPFILRHYNWKTVSANGNEMQILCDRRGKDPYTPIHFELSIQNRLEIPVSESSAEPVLAQIEPFQQELFQAFDRYVHASYPLLGFKRPHKGDISSMLRIAICCVAQSFCSAAQKLDPSIFMRFTTQGLPAKMRVAQLDTIEAALLFQQGNAYGAGFVHRNFRLP